ncbi:transglutaminase-like domain-containing protein [Marivirga salinae]|uniref:Transglutaminase-like domain-containing protein n=1 Tax=Marivirga salinarum TaxID=3059078 RepID=A0AA51NDC3_9BACT|nr:transglutaminase-like domain-containing protein [Marivirga sp. BDSF4-3]WMN13093.1 transglutaminase-like domain-containing protein [Marivirga sp. BDSF4-3]
MDKNEFKALVSLLEDEDEEVNRHVEGKIMSLGSDIIPFLEEQWENSFDPNIQRKIEDMIHTLQFSQLKERFRAWKEKGGESLLEGMWLISLYQYPDIELNDLNKEIEQVYYDIWVELQEDLHPYDKIKIINGALFTKLKFRANTKNFHSPNNSFLKSVLESKKGNPISLSVVYMLVAEKLGLPIYGVNLPNLFIITYKSEEVQFYVNAFNRGLIFSKKDIDNYLANLNLTPKPIYYEPCSNEDIIKRVLRNLIMAFEKLGEHHKSEEVKELLIEVSGGIDFDALGL